MTPTLYIFVRRDIPDMNPGKMAAQVAHAQADFDNWVVDKNVVGLSEWREDRTFGRTLVVSATLKEMQAMDMRVYHSGLTTDPTYPWKNYWGETFVSEEVTTAWAFPVTETEMEYLKQFPLHK